MKQTVFIIALMGILISNSLCGQTVANVSTGGTGWKRIAIVQGELGRGFGRITIFTQGSSYRPSMLHINWFKDWNKEGGISVHSDSKQAPDWSAVRLTNDGPSTFIEVNFSNNVTTLTTMTDGYGWRIPTLYTGILPNGGGNILATAAVARTNIENHFVVNMNGRVGIGTANPQEQLSVNGKIRTKEVKVETANWPDYVFEEGYELMPLDEVAAYIREYGHLPEIPKASEVEIDGIELGEMNKLLLKKVEELTLHLIEKDKQIRELESWKMEVEKIKSYLQLD